jgi:hypothetical protein
MMLKSVKAGNSRILFAGVLALIAQGAWSDESNDSQEPAVAVTETSVRPQVKVDINAYIEAFNERLSEELARAIEATNASRIEFAIAEVPTRG